MRLNELGHVKLLETGPAHGTLGKCLLLLLGFLLGFIVGEKVGV